MWRKSTFSGDPNSACVEVALTAGGAALRDSKNANGPVLHFSAHTPASAIRTIARLAATQLRATESP
jgi:hypothetical protein